jgi:hypothetical protein
MSEQSNRRANLITLMDDCCAWPTFSERPSPKFEDYDDTYANLAGTYLGIEWSDTPRLYKSERQTTPEADVPRWAATIYDETYTMVSVFESLHEALDYSQGSDSEYLTGAGNVIDLDHQPGVSGAVEKRTIVLTAPAWEQLQRLVSAAALAMDDDVRAELVATFSPGPHALPGLAYFTQLGREAHECGKRSAPALDRKVMAALTDLPVGGTGAAIMQAWLDGWHESNRKGK